MLIEIIEDVLIRSARDDYDGVNGDRAPTIAFGRAVPLFRKVWEAVVLVAIIRVVVVVGVHRKRGK